LPPPGRPSARLPACLTRKQWRPAGARALMALAGLPEDLARTLRQTRPRQAVEREQRKREDSEGSQRPIPASERLVVARTADCELLLRATRASANVLQSAGKELQRIASVVRANKSFKRSLQLGDPPLACAGAGILEACASLGTSMLVLAEALNEDTFGGLKQVWHCIREECAAGLDEMRELEEQEEECDQKVKEAEAQKERVSKEVSSQLQEHEQYERGSGLSSWFRKPSNSKFQQALNLQRSAVDALAACTDEAAAARMKRQKGGDAFKQTLQEVDSRCKAHLQDVLGQCAAAWESMMQALGSTASNLRRGGNKGNSLPPESLVEPSTPAAPENLPSSPDRRKGGRSDDATSPDGKELHLPSLGLGGDAATELAAAIEVCFPEDEEEDTLSDVDALNAAAAELPAGASDAAVVAVASPRSTGGGMEQSVGAHGVAGGAAAEQVASFDVGVAEQGAVLGSPPLLEELATEAVAASTRSAAQMRPQPEPQQESSTATASAAASKPRPRRTASEPRKEAASASAASGPTASASSACPSADATTRRPATTRPASTGTARRKDPEAREGGRDKKLVFEGVKKLGFEVLWESEWPSVLAVLPEGEAQRLGVEAGDVLKEINGTCTRGRTRDELMPRLKERPLELILAPPRRRPSPAADQSASGAAAATPSASPGASPRAAEAAGGGDSG